MDQFKPITPEIKNFILGFQKNEITEYYVYTHLATLANEKNKSVLLQIAQDEKKHSEIWKQYTKTDVAPHRWLLRLYPLLAKIFGITFAIRLMEKGEEKAQRGYQQVINQMPETAAIFADEQKHEQQLIDVIQEEKISYIGSIVLGLSDALVELTGALAGLSFALQDTKTVALAGLVTGIAASMSMAGSEYLSKKAESTESHPLRAAVYTGITYVVTVLLLIMPFLFMKQYQRALPVSLLTAVLIIFAFTFFSATVKNESFKKKFFEMTAITLGVATISFGIGVVLRIFFNIEA